MSQFFHSELLGAKCNGCAGNAEAACLRVWSRLLLLLLRLRCCWRLLLLLLLLLLLREGEHHAHSEQLLLFLRLLLRLHSRELLLVTLESICRVLLGWRTIQSEPREDGARKQRALTRGDRPHREGEPLGARRPLHNRGQEL